MLEKEGSLRPGRMIYMAELWPTCLGKTNRGGQAPVQIQLKAARTEGREFEPQPETLQTLPDPVLYIVIVSYIHALEHPIKKLLKTN